MVDFILAREIEILSYHKVVIDLDMRNVFRCPDFMRGKKA